MTVEGTILDEYENGCKAVRGKERFYVKLPDQTTIDFGSSSAVRPRWPDRKKPARLYAALYTQIGQFPRFEDRDKIPIDIAIAGKPAIVSYLYASHYQYYHEEYDKWDSGMDVREKLGEVVGVKPSTVQKYFRRILDEAKENRCGGIAHYRR